MFCCPKAKVIEILLFFLQEDEDKEEELHSESEAGEEEEVDVTTIERIPALCSR